MNYLRPDRLDPLARDYAAGTLTGGARRRFESLMRESAAVRLAVEVWQQRLSTLEAATPPVAPPVGNWAGVQRRLFPDSPQLAPPAATRSGWWRWLVPGGARGVAAVSGWAVVGALAGALSCVAVLRSTPGWMDTLQANQATPASYVGLLHDAKGQPTLVANSRRHGTLMTVRLLQPLPVPAGQVARLWALPDHGAPILLAALPVTGTTQASLGDTSERLFKSVRRLAVSIEPATTAPTRPLTPFVWEGDCVKVW
ncbi:anti-sigma factor [Roseateles amylovorans]|uniref:Anti-sigma factor n=1 Tax=Roseateles amylovorans TaxID=2978473 RepID=A0ABY6AUW5_9BURK|nr:anti-sigma factor [Roseateles amylovorans]UXH76164.1 anti-sigma factor [Roseateles amylovorans]